MPTLEDFNKSFVKQNMSALPDSGTFSRCSDVLTTGVSVQVILCGSGEDSEFGEYNSTSEGGGFDK